MPAPSTNPEHCPVCGQHTPPAAKHGAVIVCGNCGMALVVTPPNNRVALHADIDGLSPNELYDLRQASGVIVRGGRQAADA